MQKQVVSNTGPLITLEKLPDGYRFIRLLYDKIIVPPSVLAELVQGQFKSVEAYFDHYGIHDLIEVAEVKNKKQYTLEQLDQGEQDAILLALEKNLPLLIEEEAGRAAAQRLGLKISGIAGQILRAFRNSSVDAEEAEKKLHKLYKAGRINKKIYDGLKEIVQKEA